MIQRKRNTGLHKAVAGVFILAAALHFAAPVALAAPGQLAMNPPQQRGLAPFTITTTTVGLSSLIRRFLLMGLAPMTSAPTVSAETCS